MQSKDSLENKLLNQKQLLLKNKKTQVNWFSESDHQTIILTTVYSFIFVDVKNLVLNPPSFPLAYIVHVKLETMMLLVAGMID